MIAFAYIWIWFVGVCLIAVAATWAIDQIERRRDRQLELDVKSIGLRSGSTASRSFRFHDLTPVMRFPGVTLSVEDRPSREHDWHGAFCSTCGADEASSWADWPCLGPDDD